jgi:hypothetical protein
MAMKLKPVRFTKKDIDRVQNFACGTLSYQAPLALWIKNDSLQALDNRAKIWLYETDDDNHDIVGYGTLSKAKWFDPQDDGTMQEVKILCIPTLAIQERFWRQPRDAVSCEERFSYQLIRHLQREAVEWLKGSPVLQPLLSLIVHPENDPAKKLYKGCGFVDFPLTRPDPATGANGQCMTFKLKVD